MLTVAFGELITSRTQVQFWYNGFKKDLEDVNDDAHRLVKCEGFTHYFLQLQWLGVRQEARAHQQPMKTLKQ